MTSAEVGIADAHLLTLKQSPMENLSISKRSRNAASHDCSKSDQEHRHRKRNAFSESTSQSRWRSSILEHRYFAAQFQLPSTTAIRALLRDDGRVVCLKSYTVNRYNLCGTVLATGTDKRVFVRYTLDDWTTYQDVEAKFLDVDAANGADRFHFRLDFPFRLPNETRLQLAVASSFSNGHTHWDNKQGENYTFTYNSSFNSLNE